MALTGEGTTSAFQPPSSLHGSPKEEKKENSGMIINVVYFAAWLFKYFQTAYRLSQGIIGRPQTIAFFSDPDGIPSRMRKEGDLE